MKKRQRRSTCGAKGRFHRALQIASLSVQIAVDARCYGCVARKDRGASVCVGMTARRRDVDDRLLSVVKEELLGPAAIAEVQRLVRELLANAVADGAKRRQSMTARRSELDRGIGNLGPAVANGGLSAA